MNRTFGRTKPHPPVAPVSDNDDVSRQVRVEQLRLIFAHSADLLFLASGFALVLAGYLWTFYPTVDVLTWVGVKIGIVVPRLILARRGQQRHKKPPSRALMFGLLALDGFWWGIVGVWVARGPTEPFMVVSTYLALNAAVAIFNLQIRYAATAAYLLPLILPSSIAYFLRFDPLGICMSLGLLFLVGLMLVTARHSATGIAEVLRLRIFADQVSRQRDHALRLAQLKLEHNEEEKALQQERALVDAMRQVTQARSAFLSKVSHELRSPLQSIVSALDVFEMRQGHRSSDGEDELIARVRRASMLLNTQLRDLLTLARGHAGRLELHPEAFEVGALVDGVVLEAREAALDKSLALRVELPTATIFVVADAARIDQVLTNLVVNSVRYTQSGVVRVTLHPYDASNKRLHFTVTDTGPGIPDAVLPSFFEPDKLFSGSDGRGEGSGIGLAVVRTLIDHLGGTISVANRIPLGSTFEVEIPAELIESDSVTAGKVPQTRRVLVVDDREDVLLGLADVIQALGCACDHASTAALATDLLTAYRYDAVLLDIQMPDKTGPELAAEIRNGTGPNRRTWLIGMSAAEVATKYADGPFDVCLTKPVHRNALVGALRQDRCCF